MFSWNDAQSMMKQECFGNPVSSVSPVSHSEWKILMMYRSKPHQLHKKMAFPFMLVWSNEQVLHLKQDRFLEMLITWNTLSSSAADWREPRRRWFLLCDVLLLAPHLPRTLRIRYRTISRSQRGRDSLTVSMNNILTLGIFSEVMQQAWKLTVLFIRSWLKSVSRNNRYRKGALTGAGTVTLEVNNSSPWIGVTKGTFGECWLW